MEMNKEEVICIARHLMVQHRQDFFEKKTDRTEACTECLINTYCFGEKSEIKGTLWHHLYPKICEEAGFKCRFMVGVYPLVPYEKKDNQ